VPGEVCEELNPYLTNLKMSRLHVEGIDISIESNGNFDFISLTDMAKSRHENIIITKWLSLKNTIEYLGEWENLYNENFNYTEFGIIKNTSGGNNFVLSIKEWVSRTNAIGINGKTGRYGGTYAHKDLAFHFGMWISPRFQLLLVKEFQRLKELEQNQKGSEWDYRRFLAKANYRIHTDAIKDHIIPNLNLNRDHEWLIYADEADILNLALFGFTAKEWREQNPEFAARNLNMRDFADAHQLLVLSNLENINALLIQQEVDKLERLKVLRKNAENQLKSLANSSYHENFVRNPSQKRK
jgi:hypothetical protein